MLRLKGRLGLAAASIRAQNVSVLPSHCALVLSADVSDCLSCEDRLGRLIDIGRLSSDLFFCQMKKASRSRYAH